MREVVRAVRDRRVEAARALGRAAGARLEAVEAAHDRLLYRMIITDIEMQEWPLLGRAPVAAEERARARQVERTGDDLLPVASDDDLDLSRERRRDLLEESAVQ